MKKNMLLLVSLLFIGAQMLQAQRTISGTVVSADDNQGIPGVQVVVKGTTTGTTTNINGSYAINVPANATTLVFSFMGMTTQEREIAGMTTIDVVMGSGTQELEGVVVTALGISRSEKGLAYSVTQVGNQELIRGGDRSALNALQGKIPGLSLTSNSGAPGSSTRVLLRGFSSISGGNEPLFVVDGVPVSNNSVQNNTLNNTSDFGNPMNDINPNDVESITVLKGAAAAALYGSRAANGVILITTKSGQARERIKVDYAGTVTFTNYVPILQFQDEFGAGLFGHYMYEEQMSWGPRFDGVNRLIGHVIENPTSPNFNQQLYKPYVGLPTNVQDFYETGIQFNNSIALSGGNERTTFYASYSNVRDNGIVPTEADAYTRNAITLNAKTQGKRMTVSGSVNFIQKEVSAVGGGQGNQSLFNNIMQQPRDFSIVDMDYKNNDNDFWDFDNFYTPFSVNPYSNIYDNGQKYGENNLFGNITVSAPVREWVTLNVRLGNNFLTGRERTWTAIQRYGPYSHWYGSTSNENDGTYSLYNIFRNEFNGDAFATFNAEVSSDISITGTLGLNINHRYATAISSDVSKLTLPDFYSLSNSPDRPRTSSSWSSRRLIGAFMSADVGYKRQIFLNLAARNDWSSTLPKDNNSFFYPSVGVSWLFTETFPKLQDYISFGKLRASYGEVGNDPNAYIIHAGMGGNVAINGTFGNGLAFPLGGVSAYRVGNTIGNPELKPELTKEWEGGLDMRFLNNRIGFDVAFYKRNAVNQIMAIPIAASTGYANNWMNVGNVENKGIELSVNGTPVQTKDVRWDLTLTFTRNVNEVLELADGIERAQVGGLGGAGMGIFAEAGRPYGFFYGYGAQKTEDGKIIVDAVGAPKLSLDRSYMGKTDHDYTMGLNSAISYKGFYLVAQFDFRKGGLFFSRTASINDWAGNSVRTLYNDRNPFIVPNSVMDNPLYDEFTNPDVPKYIENTKAVDYEAYSWDFWCQGGFLKDANDLIDKTSFRAREIALGYRVNPKFLAKTPFTSIDFSVVGRNLFIWLPASNSFIDPDVTTFGNGSGAQFGEFSGYPSTRNWGFSLKASF
ncbi:MAG: SusC/RagA family TonB-linked outer membrane protein [Bacteroidales bacterium]|nr:SusC/RagA family TonB-linked outer membrane protein [Bacteroidales bacterium]